METHQSYFTWRTFKVAEGGESHEIGPTINGSLSNNLFDRKFVTHLPVLQIRNQKEEAELEQK